MSFSLYRKYRPHTFAGIVGQNSIIETLSSQSSTRQFAHAYMFTGPRGVGKTTTARILAKAANCTSPKKNGEPCDTCASCVMIREGKAMDIIEIDAASHTGVDHVRSVIIDTSRTSPSALSYKVFIIDEVHMLSASAFNALLKTLEEPPAHAIFIMATTEVHKVPETILSRCQRYTFHRIGVPDLIERLKGIAKQEGIRVDEPVLREIARRSEGSSRDAESLLGQIMAFSDTHISIEQASLVLPRSSMQEVAKFISLILDENQADAVTFLSSFVEDGGAADQFINDCIVYVRLMLLSGLKSDKLDAYISLQIPDDVYKFMKKDMGKADHVSISSLLEIFIRMKRMFTYPDIPELPLELAVYEWCGNQPKHADQPTTDNHHTPSVSSVSREASSIKKASVPQQPLKRTQIKRPLHSSASPAIPLALIKEKWQEFTNRIRSVNRSLSLSLQVSIPTAINGDTLCISVPYTFHVERLNMPLHAKLLEDELAQFFNVKLHWSCSVGQESQTKIHGGNLSDAQPRDSNLWDQIVSSFGEKLA